MFRRLIVPAAEFLVLSFSWKKKERLSALTWCKCDKMLCAIMGKAEVFLDVIKFRWRDFSLWFLMGLKASSCAQTWSQLFWWINRKRNVSEPNRSNLLATIEFLLISYFFEVWRHITRFFCMYALAGGKHCVGETSVRFSCSRWNWNKIIDTLFGLRVATK